MRLVGRIEVALLVAIAAACAPDGPPRPTGVAPFPMPNPPASRLPNAQRYEDLGELVRDEVTGLSWQRSIEVGPGENGGFVWEEAVAHCDELEQDGHDDFRLPTRLELVTLVDFTTRAPAIDSEAFPETASEAYWTASPVAADPERAFVVSFHFGETSTDLRTTEQLVRCVRTDGQPKLKRPDVRFRVEGNIVIDRLAGLRWERTPTFRATDPNDTTASFLRAAEYCRDLSFDEVTGFRVPSMKELQTLVDDTRTELAIDRDAFPGATDADYWTSSTVVQSPAEEAAGDPLSAWFVRFTDGYSQYTFLQTPNLVRCVK